MLLTKSDSTLLLLQCCLKEVFRAGPDRLCMVLELCAGGSLEQHVSQCVCRSPAGGLPETEARHLFEQLAKAVIFCHSRGVAHRYRLLANRIPFFRSRDGFINAL